MYDPTLWEDGENKYDIVDQNGNVIQSNIKLIYKGNGGTPVSATNMNKNEQGTAAAHELIEQHVADTDNPHEVTPEQIGALPASSYTADDVFAKLKTVDGQGSGLDTDLVRGAVGFNVNNASPMEFIGSAVASGGNNTTELSLTGLNTAQYKKLIIRFHFVAAENGGTSAKIVVNGFSPATYGIRAASSSVAHASNNSEVGQVTDSLNPASYGEIEICNTKLDSVPAYYSGGTIRFAGLARYVTNDKHYSLGFTITANGGNFVPPITSISFLSNAFSSEIKFEDGSKFELYGVR